MNKPNRKARREQKRKLGKGDYSDYEEVAPNQRVVKKQLGPIRAMTEAQGQLLAQIKAKDIVFATGPAGTGKTFVSAGSAADELREGNIEQIVVCRPMQSCDEDMGFLPGDAQEKYAPWIAPVADVFNQRLGKSHTEAMVKGGKIAYMPLMTMRGASFKDAWILLDEAQNTTPEQMKMFLTRIGDNCKMIISGDTAQSDLKDGRGVMRQNGLEDAIRRVTRLPAVGHVEFSIDDIVRHGIIREILECYQ